ncbi:Spermidine/putrescine import ATP-binding protein PotA [Pseudomonas extremaustralis]|uniref:Spermidine/putrescine import ATP-binding protein PotA n=1 Tax=Pseudomonas extremaustralis TaxID=359110 RepID=A0A5M9IR44_9PSED|nr:ABC transporter ATP-binding protein [Pseudomonas extremaustralis]KAA8558319.1 Spermidine/putrescine import ATP-binding protein PotA [Pseudomonas extremaustralis]
MSTLSETFAIELQNVCKTFLSDAHGKPEYAVNAVNLQIRQGEFFTFLGPSGCGKTTTLRMIGGFELPSSGTILLNGQDVSNLPAHRRNINTVFQSYALFPHLRVLENVAFGLAVKRVPKAERLERAMKALEQVRMAHTADRRPSALSGGQQQRIALARALVNEPDVLLLDEPFGALDMKLRREMQLEVKEMQRRLGITFIFVTHDQEEALTMSDRIAVMSSGQVQQVDHPIEIYEKPANRFTAGFIGEMNMLHATVLGVKDGVLLLRTGGSEVPWHGGQMASGEQLIVAMRPEALSIVEQAGDDQVLFKGKVGDAIYIGSDRRYAVHLPTGGHLLVRVPNHAFGAQKILCQGDAVQVACPLAALHFLSH